MDPIAKTLLALHIVAGTAALLAGALPLFAPKRRGFHTRWGGRYVLCMWVVLGSAAALTLISRNAYFAALTVSATLGCFSGVRVLRRKRADQRAAPLDWIVTAAALAFASALAMLHVSGRVSGNPTVIYALLGGVFAVGGYDLLRFARPLGWPWFPGLWFYEHLVKMITSYAAVMSAFSGSIAFQFLPDPWKQLWATLVFQTLTLAMIAWYMRQRRRAARAATA